MKINYLKIFIWIKFDFRKEEIYLRNIKKGRKKKVKGM